MAAWTTKWSHINPSISKKQRVHTRNGVSLFNIKVSLQWHTSYKKGYSLKPFPNSFINRGPSTQTFEPTGETLIQTIKLLSIKNILCYNFEIFYLSLIVTKKSMCNTYKKWNKAY